MTRKNQILASLKDSRGRPIMLLMRTKRDTIMRVFKRYRDMRLEEKKLLLGLLRDAASGSGDAMIASESEMSDFLDFKDDRPCG